MSGTQDSWVERFVQNRWVQFLLAVGGILGLVAIIVPMVTDGGEGAPSDYQIVAVEPGAPDDIPADAEYVGAKILRAWSGPDGRGPSLWGANRPVMIYGVVSEQNLVAPVSADTPVGIELEIPRGSVAMRLIASQIGEPAVPITFRFQLGTDVFFSTVTGGDRPQGITLDFEPELSSIRIDVSVARGYEGEDKVDAVLAFGRLEVAD